MVYWRKPRLPIDLIFPTEVEFNEELEPKDFVREKQEAMNRVRGIGTGRKHPETEVPA